MCLKLALLELIGCIQVDGHPDLGMQQHCLDGIDDLGHLLVGQPVFLAQHLQADVAILHIGVPDGGLELDVGELEGELLGEVEVEFEFAVVIGGPNGALDYDLPVEEVVLLLARDVAGLIL